MFFKQQEHMQHLLYNFKHSRVPVFYAHFDSCWYFKSYICNKDYGSKYVFF